MRCRRLRKEFQKGGEQESLGKEVQERMQETCWGRETNNLGGFFGGCSPKRPAGKTQEKCLTWPVLPPVSFHHIYTLSGWMTRVPFV